MSNNDNSQSNPIAQMTLKHKHVLSDNSMQKKNG